MPPRSTSRTRSSDHELANLLDDLRNLHATLEQAAADPRLEHQALNPGYRASAQNLLAYLALRRQDLHRLQLQLSAQGLSSLGRSEAAVLRLRARPSNLPRMPIGSREERFRDRCRVHVRPQVHEQQALIDG